MPPRSRPEWTDSLDVMGALEEELTSAQLQGLYQGLDQAGRDRDDWLAVPALRAAYGGHALFNFVAGVKREDGASEDRALSLAEIRFGIPKDTLKSWLLRWRNAA